MFSGACGWGDLGGRMTDPPSCRVGAGVFAAAGAVDGGMPSAVGEAPLAASIFCLKTLGKSWKSAFFCGIQR